MTVSPGMAKLICVPTMPATATPSTSPLALTTGPPELPGLMPPLTWMRSSRPSGSLRMLLTVVLLIVMSLPISVLNGKPAT
jgi:hypothetical protein